MTIVLQLMKLFERGCASSSPDSNREEMSVNMNMNDMLAFTPDRSDAEKCIFSIA